MRPHVRPGTTNQCTSEVALACYRPVSKYPVSSNQTLMATKPAHHRATMTPTVTTNRLGPGRVLVKCRLSTAADPALGHHAFLQSDDANVLRPAPFQRHISMAEQVRPEGCLVIVRLAIGFGSGSAWGPPDPSTSLAWTHGLPRTTIEVLGVPDEGGRRTAWRLRRSRLGKATAFQHAE